MYRSVAGVGPAPDVKDSRDHGYRRILIAPKLTSASTVGGPTRASAVLQTVSGRVTVDWRLAQASNQTSFTLSCGIPIGSTATVVVPLQNGMPPVPNGIIFEGSKVVWSAGKFKPGVPGIISGSAVGTAGISFEILSGEYIFAYQV